MPGSVTIGHTGSERFAAIYDSHWPPGYTETTVNDTGGYWVKFDSGSNQSAGYVHVEVASGTVGIVSFVAKAGIPFNSIATLADMDQYAIDGPHSVGATCATPGNGTPFWVCVWSPSGANATLVAYHNTHAPQAAYPTNFSLSQVGSSWILTCTTTSYGCALHWGLPSTGRDPIDLTNCVAGSDVGGVWTYSVDVTAIHGSYAKFICRGVVPTYPFYPSSAVSFHC